MAAIIAQKKLKRNENPVFPVRDLIYAPSPHNLVNHYVNILMGEVET